MQSPKYKLKDDLLQAVQNIPGAKIVCDSLNENGFLCVTNMWQVQRLLKSEENVSEVILTFRTICAGCTFDRVWKEILDPSKVMLHVLENNCISQILKDNVCFHGIGSIFGGKTVYFVFVRQPFFELDYAALRETMKPLAEELARVVFSPP